jgi:hypothetical protein
MSVCRSAVAVVDAAPGGTSHSPARRLTVGSAVQVVIMLATGAAAAARFTPVHDVAAALGQAGWLAWADAVVLELMSVASGLEMRRRTRFGSPVWSSAAVLVIAVTLLLSAQVVEARASPIGWIAAAIPALGFLVMVKVALAQTGHAPVGAGSVLPEPHLDPDVRAEATDIPADDPAAVGVAAEQTATDASEQSAADSSETASSVSLGLGRKRSWTTSVDPMADPVVGPLHSGCPQHRRRARRSRTVPIPQM